MEEKINRHCICAVCFKRTQKSACRPMSGQKNEKLRRFVFDTYNITITDEKSVICNKCRQKYNNFYRRKRPNTDVKERFDPTYLPTQEPEMNNNSQEELHFNVAIKRAGASHACCFLCRKPGPKMVTVKKAARFDLFVQTGVLLAKSARCCPRHFCLEHFDNESIQRVLKNEIKISNESNFSSKEMSDVIEHVRLLAYTNQNKRIVFDNYLDEEAYVTLTGLDKASFNDLATHVTDVRKSQYRNTNNCLGVFLTKMRTGLSNQILATLFHMKKSHVRRSIAKIRNSLSGSFVRSHLGFDHISRKNVIQTKTRPLAKILFSENENSPPAILVLDGTYLYIQKSSQFKFQRKTFSMHKKRPLVKPMMVVTTSGYIVSVIGPYFSNGKNNDASILSHIIRQNTEQIKSWLHSDDVFIVDRGFRDSLSYLKEIGIRAEMPTFLQKGEKQFSSADANKTRLITKVRWVVESANARLKQWRFFEKVVPNSHLPHLQTYLRITCAILNKYKPPLSQTKNELDDISEATKMLALSKQNNSLQQFVNDKLDCSRKCWKSIHSVELQDFPKLNDQQLREFIR